jgi:WD40 repeat protein
LISVIPGQARMPDSSGEALFDLALIDRHVHSDTFVERAWAYRAVEAALDRPGNRLVLLTGDPGSGKSTIMAGLAAANPSWARYFIRRVDEESDGEHRRSGDLASFLIVTGLQLAALWPQRLSDHSMDPVYQEVGEVGPDEEVVGVTADALIANPFLAAGRQLMVEVHQRAGTVRGKLTGVDIGTLVLEPRLRPLVMVEPALVAPATALARSHPGERIVILIDGLDELRFRAVAADVGEWLASTAALPPNIQFVVASRPDEPRLAGIRAALGDTLQPIDLNSAAQEQPQDIETYLTLAVRTGTVASGVHSDRFVKTVAAKAKGNFQYAALVAREARDVTDVAAWLEQLQNLPADLNHLYGHFLLRVHDELLPATTWPTVYHPLLSLLTVARTSLTPSQLAALAPVPTPADAEEALRRLRHFVDRDSSGRWRLFHASFAEFLVAEQTRSDRDFADLACDAPATHRHIVDDALSKHGDDGSWAVADPYLLGHLAGHAGAAGVIDSILADPRFLLAAEPAGLTAAFTEAGTTSPIAAIYRQSLPALRDGGVAAAVPHWELYARRGGLVDFADRVSRLEHGQWRPLWVDPQAAAIRDVLGEHASEVTAIAAAPVDGVATALTGGRDGQIRLWDLAQSQQIGVLRHAEGDVVVTALATAELNSGEAIAVSGASDGTVRAWNLARRTPLSISLAGIENAGEAVAVAHGGDGPIGIYRTGDHLRAWDLSARRPIGPQILAVRADRVAVAIHDGQVLIACGQRDQTGTVRVWDAVTGQQMGATVRLPDSWISALAIAWVGNRLLAAVAGHDVQAWDVLTGEPAGEPIWAWDVIDALALQDIAGRSLLAIVGRRGRVSIVDPTAGQSPGAIGDPTTDAPPGEILSGNLPYPVTAMVWNGRVLLAAGGRSSAPVARIWKWNQAGTLQPYGREIATGELAKSIAVTLWDGQPAVAATGADRRTRVLDAATGNLLADPAANSSWSGFGDRVYSVAAATIGGRTVIAAGAGETVRFWDLGEVPLRAAGTADAVASTVTRRDDGSAVGLCEVDGRPAVVCVTRRDGTYLWDPATGDAPRRVAEPTGGYVRSTALGQVAGRPALARAGSGDVGVRLNELPGGRELWSVSLDPGDTTVGLTGDGLVVAADIGGTFRVWDPVADTEREPIRAAPDLRVMAVTSVGGAPVAVYGGTSSGIVRAVSLLPAEASPAFPVADLAVTQQGGRPAVLAGGRAGVRVLWADTGETAAPTPAIDPLPRVTAVAAAMVGGQPVGICSAGSEVQVWDIETGALIRTLESERGFHGGTLLTTRLGDRAVIVHAGFEVRAWDLATGEAVIRPFRPKGGQAAAVAAATVEGRPVLVTADSLVTRARYLLTAVEEDELERRQSEAWERNWLDAVTAAPLGEETPPSTPRIGENLSRPGSPTALAVGEAGAQPFAVTGYQDGTIDNFMIRDALPWEPPIKAHATPVGAIACGEVCGRPVIVSGGFDGTVCFWDLATRSRLATVRVLSPVQSIVIAGPHQCVVGTEHGPLAFDVFLPAPAAGTQVTLPVDSRAARSCPQHALAPGPRAFDPGHWYCIKGIQLGHPSHRLVLVQGHCMILPGVLLFTAPELGAGRTVDIPVGRRYYLEPQDAELAYEADGGHFRLRLQFIGTDGQHDVSLCFYTRSARDRFHQHLRTAWKQ